jgi:trehalose 6-phosphate synthase/phosphatase
MKEVNMQKSERLLIVSNRLPVNIDRDGDQFIYHPSVGGLATSLSNLQDKMEMLWLGWSGIRDIDDDHRPILIEALRKEYKCLPIFLSQDVFDKYYDGFSNGCLWPLFHYFPQYAHYDTDEWLSYQEVNRAFSEKIIEIFQSGDMIWIHDYHLMLLPAMVRERIPEAKIGFFLHIPFPSFELLRMLPWREKILQGLLGSDLIGFHSYGYTRHFLSSALRLLGLDHDFGTITYKNRTIKVDTFPLGIDVNRFSQALDNPDIQNEVKSLKRKVDDYKVILSVDRLDFTKGIKERLLAFESFLDANPNWQEKVILISLCVPSRIRVPEYQSLKQQVDELIGRINGRFGKPGWSPIWYLYRSLPFDKLVPLYQIADIALVTPLRDGMNLVAKEYLASKSDGTGVLILSETAGAARELGEAIIINPYDQKAIEDALSQALNMSLDNQRQRNEPMLQRLRRYNIHRWADDFVSELAKTQKEDSRKPSEIEVGYWRGQLIHQFKNSHRRILFLDYDGTLVPIRQNPDEAIPDAALLNQLNTLCEVENSEVYIVSGREHETLQSWLGNPKLGIIAEHGAQIKMPFSQTWQETEYSSQNGWKDQLLPLLEVYVDRTPGTELEQKTFALAWHYRKAEPEMGSLRAKELVDDLEGFIANTPLQILHGKKVIEIKDSTISKGSAVRNILEGRKDIDFILAIGDDVTDEDMFDAIPEDSWSIKVGEGEQSNATYFLHSYKDVRNLLNELTH